MSNVAHLPIVADRYVPCRRQVYVVGLDLTGIDMRAQVRPGGDVPGVPLVDLLTVTNANAEGLRFVGVDFASGVAISHVEIVINETTMEGLPYAGEVGDETALAWDWQATIAGRKRRFAKGAFVVLGDGVTGADDAPVNRPLGYGRSRLPVQGMRDRVTLTFGDDVVRVVIDGAEHLGELVLRSEEAADRAAESVTLFTEGTHNASLIVDPSNAALTGTGDTGGFTLIEPVTFGSLGMTGAGHIDRFTVYCAQAIPGAKFKVLRALSNGRYTWVAEVTKDFPAGVTTYTSPDDFTSIPVTTDCVMAVYAPTAGYAYRSGPAYLAGSGAAIAGDFKGTNVAPVVENSSQWLMKARVRYDDRPELIEEISNVVGEPPFLTRGNLLLNGTVNLSATATRTWTILVSEDGILQAVNAYIGRAGNLSIVVIDPDGKVVYVQDVAASTTGIVRIPLPKPIAITALSRVCLTEAVGRIAYQDSGTAVVLAAPGRPGFGMTPAQVTVVATPSLNYEVVVPLAGTAVTDVNFLNAANRPRFRVNGAGDLIVSYPDGTTQNAGSVTGVTESLPYLAVYGANDPPPGPGSTMSFNRTGLVVPAANGSNVPAYRKAHAANPSVLLFGDLVYMYFRVDPGTDVQSVALWTQPIAGFDPLDTSRWTDRGVVIGVPVGAAYDGVWDPHAIVFGGKIRMYWNSHTGTKNLFTSESVDGFTFTAAVNTGVQFAGAPSVAVVGATLYVFYGNDTPPGLVRRSSTDGVTFGAATVGNVISATGEPRDPDGAAIVTSRYFYQAPYLYMVYGGTPLGYEPNDFGDWPEGQCLARSLAPFTTWQKYPANPILLRGPVGAYDAAATWSGSYLRLNDRSWLFYEAMGGSDLASRGIPYRGFGTTAFSQIAVAEAPDDATLANWNVGTSDLPEGVYTIRNLLSGRYLGATATDDDGVICQYVTPQTWIVRQHSDGFYLLSLQASGPFGSQLLDNTGASDFEGARLGLYPLLAGEDFPTPSQEFKLTPYSHDAPGKGVYGIINRYHGMHATADDTAEASLITSRPQTLKLGQKWQFTRVGS
jgi:hypothetical protein